MLSQRLVLRFSSLAGAAIFLAFLSFTFYIPGWVESFAHNFIEQEVAERVDSRIDSIGPPKGKNALAKFAKAAYKHNQQQIDSMKESLKAEAH